jgi:diphthine-ammonia ligase
MSWVSLFSGGKDSSWALYRALEADLDVSHLMTVHPAEDAYMYHVPATTLAGLAAESIGLPLIEVDAADIDTDHRGDAGRQGDREIVPLEEALRSFKAERRLDGIVAGAVESEFQTSRLRDLADRLDAQLYAPLWQADPRSLIGSMLESGLEITIIQVAAGGLGPEWLGRRLDRAAVEELERIGDRHGVHLLGEGGEFETFVTDGPHMDREIRIQGEPMWEGTRGHLEITDARLDA